MSRQSKLVPAKPKPGRPRASRAHARRRAARSSPGVLIGAAVLLAFVAALIYLVVQEVANSNRAAQAIEGVRSYANQPRGHETGPLTYDQSPPAGGVHNPAWQNCGVYTQPIANENAVHALEHGAVWITYAPDLPAEEVQQLQAFTRASGFRLLSPYSGLPSAIVASAWGFQLHLESAGDPRLGQFVEKYELSPLSPEPGAPCTGGVGQPG